MALARSYDRVSMLPGSSERELDDLGKKARRALPRRERDQLGHLAAEVAGAVVGRPGVLREAVDAYLDRAALVSIGDYGMALRAAATLSKSADATAPRMRRLLSWCTSPDLAETYRRAGIGI